MSRRARIALAVIGLAMICLSAAALAYALAPVDKTREQFRPAPTLFAPPISSNRLHPESDNLAGWPAGSWE
jgi:hypothetical protein